jgi:putative transposase
VRFLKKSNGVLCQERRVKYALIREHTKEYEVALMCKMLELPRSSYYRWQKCPVSKKQQRRSLVGLAVESTYREYKKRYGAPRLTEELNAQGIECSMNHVAELLRERGLRALNGKGFKYRPRIESKNNAMDNKLNREFEAEGPNQKWVSDITYIKAGRKWLYLAAVQDLFSRKIVGWSLDTHMREDLIIDAFKMAAMNRDIKQQGLIHSDRGVQYRSNSYQEALESNGFQSSMSRKGNCWDNAVMESFFSRLKVELIYPENYRTVEEARAGIFEYIELFYNRVRRHSANGYLSPNDYEQQFMN